jgi:very-short-patch-repair endonuclease
MTASDLERALLTQIRMFNLPKPVAEFYAIPGRRFRFDFCWEEERLLCEIQGGIWMKNRSGHSSGTGINRDTEKANLAVLAGWRVLAFTGDQIKSGQAIQWLKQALEKKA